MNLLINPDLRRCPNIRNSAYMSDSSPIDLSIFNLTNDASGSVSSVTVGPKLNEMNVGHHKLIYKVEFLNTSAMLVFDPALETITPYEYEIDVSIDPCLATVIAPCFGETCSKTQEFVIDDNFEKDEDGKPLNTSLDLNITFV
jgi:hypothetical protein